MIEDGSYVEVRATDQRGATTTEGEFVSKRYVILLGSLLAFASCQSSVDDPPDFVGNYSPIHPYNTEGETSYVIRVLEDGRALYEDTSCFDTGSEPREGRWEMRGNRLVFLPLESASQQPGAMARAGVGSAG